MSIAVIAISNFPSIKFVSWKTELGVLVRLSSIPPLAKYPLSCAAQIGPLKPPGKTMTETGSRLCCARAPPRLTAPMIADVAIASADASKV